MHDNRNYKIHEIDAIYIDDFNNIFGSDNAKGVRKAKPEAKSPQEMLAMI